MPLKETVKKLSDIERRTLRALETGEAVLIESLEQGAGIPLDSVRRAVQWLKEKNLIASTEKHSSFVALTEEGQRAAREGLPEQLLMGALRDAGGSLSLSAAQNQCDLSFSAFNAALGRAKRARHIHITKEGKETQLTLTGDYKEVIEEKSLLQQLLLALSTKELEVKRLDKTERRALEELIRRGLAQKREETALTVEISKEGKQAAALMELFTERTFDLAAGVAPHYVGKRQPYVQFLNAVQEKLVRMGFQEMHAPLATQEFYNFDVLFQPQDHPARDWSDTYRLKRPEHGKLPSQKIVKAVAAAHEHGGKGPSKGWGYKWNPKIAMQMMPTAHGTAHSARQLVNGVTVPGKYFALARCYRPDVVDRTHLIEFTQLDGFIVGELNFRHLLGQLKQFAVEVAGAKKVRFYPDYYPFTEPSVQLSAKHPEMGWIEFGGAGLFRPEMMEAMGLPNTPALAWGLGVDRLALFKLGIADVRGLFSTDLSWLRSQPLLEGF